MGAASECITGTRRECYRSSASADGWLLELQVLAVCRRCGQHGGFGGASFSCCGFPGNQSRRSRSPGPPTGETRILDFLREGGGSGGSWKQPWMTCVLVSYRPWAGFSPVAVLNDPDSMRFRAHPFAVETDGTTRGEPSLANLSLERGVKPGESRVTEPGPLLQSFLRK